MNWNDLHEASDRIEAMAPMDGLQETLRLCKEFKARCQQRLSLTVTERIDPEFGYVQPLLFPVEVAA